MSWYLSCSFFKFGANMKTKNVVIKPYNKNWHYDFIKIKDELNQSLNGDIIEIEHIGSTAVFGMSAKPIIDIDVIISDYERFDCVKNKLTKIGYIYEGDLGIAEREAFSYTGKEHLTAHHLYVCPQNSPELKRHIMFRNYLRKNPAAALEYSRIKTEGAEMFPYDIDSYIEYKGEFIKKVYKALNI